MTALGKSRVGAVLAALVGLFSAHAAVPFGETTIPPKTVFRFGAPLSQRAQFVLQRSGHAVVPHAIGALWLPPKFDPNAAAPPLLIISGTSEGTGSSIAAMGGFTNAASRLGWALLAADGPDGRPPKETLNWRWSMLSSALERVHEYWPNSDKWPVACAGFSGGAKWSPYIAALLVKQNYDVRGVFMSGANEDTPSLAFRYYHPPAAFKAVPFFISTGTIDTIAPPRVQSLMRDGMLRTGFTQVRQASFAGGHRLDQLHVDLALKWFLATPPRPRPTAPAPPPEAADAAATAPTLDAPNQPGAAPAAPVDKAP